MFCPARLSYFSWHGPIRTMKNTLHCPLLFSYAAIPILLLPNIYLTLHYPIITQHYPALPYPALPYPALSTMAALPPLVHALPGTIEINVPCTPQSSYTNIRFLHIQLTSYDDGKNDRKCSIYNLFEV